MLRALVVTACAAEVAGFAPTFFGTNNNALRTQGGVRAPLQAPMMRSSESDDTDGTSLSASRRKVLELGSMAALSLMLPGPAFAKRLSDIKQPMDELDPDETADERKERKKKERDAYRLKAKELEDRAKNLGDVKTPEAEMGSNLRGDYYYPTARKRYLPRVRKAYESIEEVLATNPDMEKLKVAVKGPLDAGGPLKLYVSALGGGGLSINSKFMSSMRTEAEQYDVAYKSLQEAVKKSDGKAAVTYIQEMKTHIVAYRQAGKPAGLTNDDWGVGEIPDCRNEEGGGVGKMSKCAVGSSFGNANPNLYSRNVKKIQETTAP